MVYPKDRLRILAFVLLAGLVTFLAFLLTPKSPVSTISPITSDYYLNQKLVVNQTSYYPIQQTLNSQLYRPIERWIGRLILPNLEEFQHNSDRDWVWIEIYHAPLVEQKLVGQKIRLAWQRSPSVEKYLKLVTTDIRFTEATKQSKQEGNLVPTRLNGRSQVGSLQALAGARTNDDVLVGFSQAQISSNSQSTTLRITDMPVMVTGRYVALVNILGEAVPRSSKDIPAQCPGASPCPSELIQIQHYNPQSGKFDGAIETVRIPQQPLGSNQHFISTPRQLAKSPAGKLGWYLYGAQGKDGLFTVQALQPRSLLQLQPTATVIGQQAGFDYIDYRNWEKTAEQKGTIQRILISPQQESPETALGFWQEGDRGLGIHLFGGIGGEKGEPNTLGTVTGHFSYFLPQVVRDPFTNELQWRITYYQVYAHNSQGILSGTQSWANYMGNLERGWLNSRPTSDVIIKSDVLQDYDFDGVVLSPLTALRQQLEIMMARYRTGDGTGTASVTPAASCVQDSNQALYITIEILKQQVAQTPAITNWLKNHPHTTQTRRFQRLVQLGDRLTQTLSPRGVIRTDWKDNAKALAATTESDNYPFIKNNTLINALLSWKSMLPRIGHDTISKIFLEQGATLWILRTNQVGGDMPEIIPLAPTNLFGEVSFISATLRHILASLIFLPSMKEWGITFGLLFVYAAIAIPIGLKFQFLQWQPTKLKPTQLGTLLVWLFFFPAFAEELIFRVILLPYPDGSVAWEMQFAFTATSLALFILYHPFNALTFYKAGNPTFFNPIFLGLAAFLGLVCASVYFATGSIWTITVLHWLVVVVWLLLFNGLSKLKAHSINTSDKISKQ